jgi:isoleucyl-tRNA synthetase
VALEITITPELRREGYAREVVRLVQEARKTDGLDVSDRISLRWAAADPELTAALTEHGPLISGEVLATDYGPAEAGGAAAAGAAGAGAEGQDGAGGFVHAEPELELTFWLRKA